MLDVAVSQREFQRRKTLIERQSEREFLRYASIDFVFAGVSNLPSCPSSSLVPEKWCRSTVARMTYVIYVSVFIAILPPSRLCNLGIVAERVKRGETPHPLGRLVIDINCIRGAWSCRMRLKGDGRQNSYKY